MPQQTPSAIPDITDTIRTNYVGFASFAVLIWDHVDTFADEVELIWKGKKGLFIYLFLFNRYFTPLGFIINLYAYLSPSWTFERCARFVRYEGVTVAMAVEVVGLMMLLRINALCPDKKWIIKGLAGLLLLETVLNVWLISGAGPVLHNPDSGIHACSMVFDTPIRALASASAWVPLLYDTIIFGLTLYRTVPPLRREEASYIIKRLLEDGLLYYSVIFSVTFVLTFMIVAAPPGTKNIAAQTEQLITVAMMSRITLNLKKAGEKMNADDSPKSLLFDRKRRRRSEGYNLEAGTFIMSLPPPTFPAVTLGAQVGGNELVFAHPSPLPTPCSVNESFELNPFHEARSHRKPPPALLLHSSPAHFV